MEINTMLSMPRTISSTVKVKNAIQIDGSVSQSMYVPHKRCLTGREDYAGCLMQPRTAKYRTKITPTPVSEYFAGAASDPTGVSAIVVQAIDDMFVNAR
jgi:hypothetical protein